VNILIFGATGMVGQGVLRECLLAADAERVQRVGRTATGQRYPKLHEIMHGDLWNYGAIEPQLQNFDACFLCLGVSSSRMAEAQYTHMAYDLTLAAARTAPHKAAACGRGSRAEPRTRCSLYPSRPAYLFRPSVIQPLHGARFKTASHRLSYAVTKPLLPVLRLIFCNFVLTTEMVGEAMLAGARHGANQAVLEAGDISAICATAARS
jgi:hypothetical protein